MTAELVGIPLDFQIVWYRVGCGVGAVYKLLLESRLFDDDFSKRLQIILLWLGEAAKNANVHFGYKKERLTAMADYRLPQIMCHLGIIELTPQGSELLVNRITNYQFERDMRSAAIEVCARIAKITGKCEADVDTIFWRLSQEVIASQSMSIPAMRVATRSY